MPGLLVDYLGIEKLLCGGGRLHGRHAGLAWLVRHPERIRSAIPIATARNNPPADRLQ